MNLVQQPISRLLRGRLASYAILSPAWPVFPLVAQHSPDESEKATLLLPAIASLLSQ